MIGSVLVKLRVIKPIMHKIPVTIITGFLGAGKTTIIRHLLQNNQGKRIAVLVNEFGEIGIDGDLLKSCQICDEDEILNPIIELTNGCLCCTVQEEFYPTMQALLKRKDSIDFILIETSGLALPKPLIQAFKWEDIRNSTTVDGVITVVDAWALSEGNIVADIESLMQQRLADDSLEHETPIEELFEDQLACADLVLLTKTDLINEEKKTQVKHWLSSEMKNNIKIFDCRQGQVNADVILGFNAAVEDDLDNRPSHHDHEEDHDHDDGINSVELVLDQTVNKEDLLQRLSQLMENQEIYRIKGFVNIPQKPMRLVLQGVGKRLETFFDRPWKPDEFRQTKLVFIGRYLDANLIQSSL